MTPAQLATLRADIAADVVLNALPNNGDAAQTIADAYNQLAVPDFLVWGTHVSVLNILNTIDGAKFSPNDAVPTGTDLAYLSRSINIQIKMMSLDLLFAKRDTVDCSQANIRKWIHDAVINYPSGAAGALLDPGGANGVTSLTALLRKATRAEKLFAAAAQATSGVTGAVLTFEGNVAGSDVVNARAN